MTGEVLSWFNTSSAIISFLYFSLQFPIKYMFKTDKKSVNVTFYYITLLKLQTTNGIT